MKIKRKINMKIKPLFQSNIDLPFYLNEKKYLSLYLKINQISYSIN
jgi:hypothetical protein